MMYLDEPIAARSSVCSVKRRFARSVVRLEHVEAVWSDGHTEFAGEIGKSLNFEGGIHPLGRRPRARASLRSIECQ